MQATPFNRFIHNIEECGLLVNLRDRDNLPTKDKILAPNMHMSVAQEFHLNLLGGHHYCQNVRSTTGYFLNLNKGEWVDSN